MKEFDDYSTKEQKQLAICQRLISEKATFLRKRFAAISSTMVLPELASQRYPVC
jgi:hypothetical protein